MRRNLLQSLRSAIPLSLLLAAYLAASETLHLTLRSPYFISDLGPAFITIAAWYALFAVGSGPLIACVIRERRAQALALGMLGYLLVSLKIMWLDAGLLAVPRIAVMFIVFTGAWFVGARQITKRLQLPDTFPIVLSMVYANVCLAIASGWALGGGRLLPFLLSPRTVEIVVGGVVVLVGSVLVQRSVERRESRWGSPAVLAGHFVALVLATFVAARGLPRIPEAQAATTTTGAPDIYVLSFDALRSDMLEAYVASHPASNLARIRQQGTSYDNVVAHGLATDSILANNTFAGGGETSCAGSIPARLARRGYFTAMLFGRLGRRFEGSDCYEYYYSGGRDALVGRYALPALASAFADDAAALRHNMLGAHELVDKLHQLAGATTPLYAYVHFLELHAPYVPDSDRDNRASEAAMREFMRRCYTVACDLSDPENARLLENAKRAYIMLLDQADRAVGDVLAIARQRNRPFVVVVTADHGELFGEHGGFAHSGGFVPELLDVPFLVLDSRDPSPKRRCELMFSSEAVRAVTMSVVGADDVVYPDRNVLELVAAPLGRAWVDKNSSTVRFELSHGMDRHAGTWRNIHRVENGTMPYPIASCD